MSNLNFVGDQGIEPCTSRSQSERSTDELVPEKSAASGTRTHKAEGHWILSPTCIPFHHRGATLSILTEQKPNL